MNLQETIRRIIKEVRVPRSERVELYSDNNIIVVVPLTHRALQKYAHECQWCINSDLGEWEDYHKGKHAVIIQRNPKKPKIGITGNPTASEIFLLSKWDNNESDFDDVCQMLDYEFRNDRTMSDYYVTISNDINNFATNIVYYSPENGVYDQEDNFLWNFNYEITDIPNVTPEVIKIMDDYLQENEEMSLQETIRRILREMTKSVKCKCGWSWKLSEGGDDPYVCHKCGRDNSDKYIQETLMEEVKSTFVKRRYDILRKYIRSAYNWLSPDRFKDFDEFMERVIFSTIRDFTSEQGGNDYDKILELREEIGDDIREIVMNEFYDEIYQYYNDNK